MPPRMGAIMVVQARAEATRKRIIDAAVELFESVGYGDTGLSDVMARANVTKGAFYYHFTSKESVAAAIVAQSEEEFRTTMIGIIGAPDSPPLDNLMRSTFVAADVHRRDRLSRVANQLRQSLSQISSTSSEVYTRRQATILPVMVDAIHRAVDQGDLSVDIDADDLAHTLWAAALGNRILSDAIGDDLFARLAQIWQVLLRGIAPAESVAYFQELARRMTQQYADHGISRP